MVKLMLDRVDRLCTAAPTVLVLDDCTTPTRPACCCGTG